MKVLRRYIGFALTICAAALQAQQATQLPVYDVTPDSSAEVRANAIQALNQGYMLRFVGASQQDIEQIFGARLGDFKILDRQRSSAGPERRERLVLKAIAGYRDAQGVPHVLESYAPENDTGQDGEPGWQGNLDAWIAQEQARAAQLVNDDPTPPADTWIKLYYATVQARSSVANVAQETMGVYRLASTGSNSDYYMVYTIPQATPDFGYCNGYDHCGWHTTNRGFHIVTTQATSLADHGPTGTVGGGDGGVSVTIGADLSASFAFNWSQQDVTTVDAATGTSANWYETFNIPWPQCNPLFGRVPGTSQSTFLSRQAAIFAVPSGTQQVNFNIVSDSGFCLYDQNVLTGTQRDGVSIAANLLLGPPQLFASPQSLVIPAGGSATLLVNAFIPNSPIGFAWTSASSQSWLTIPSGGPFSGPKALQVSVAPDTPKGATGTIAINSSPPFAAPSVGSGPIEISVTVGTPPSQNTAGVLIFGGLSSPSQIANTPEYYDPSAKVILPTARQFS